MLFIDLSIHWNIYIVFLMLIVHFSVVPGTQNKDLIFPVFLFIVSRYFSICFCHFVYVLSSEVMYEG